MGKNDTNNDGDITNKNINNDKSNCFTTTMTNNAKLLRDAQQEYHQQLHHHHMHEHVDGATLLLVDVQNDFHPGGALGIPDADKDAARIASFILQNISSLDRIVATMDSHQKLHIAHPCFWFDGVTGTEHPAPFTIISKQDIESGLWKPRTDIQINEHMLLDPSIFGDVAAVCDEDGVIDLNKYVLEYTHRLEAAGRFQLCIWPEHCLIGSRGHAMVDEVRLACEEWSQVTGKTVQWVLKGQHILTEMYSAVASDVPVTVDTAVNMKLQNTLCRAKPLLVAGQASSHCVNYTVRDLVEVNGGCDAVEKNSNIVLFTDCMSAVPGFEKAADTFFHEMKEAGVQLTTSSQFQFSKYDTIPSN